MSYDQLARAPRGSGIKRPAANFGGFSQSDRSYKRHQGDGGRSGPMHNGATGPDFRVQFQQQLAQQLRTGGLFRNPRGRGPAWSGDRSQKDTVSNTSRVAEKMRADPSFSGLPGAPALARKALFNAKPVSTLDKPDGFPFFYSSDGSEAGIYGLPVNDGASHYFNVRLLRNDYQFTLKALGKESFLFVNRVEIAEMYATVNFNTVNDLRLASVTFVNMMLSLGVRPTTAAVSPAISSNMKHATPHEAGPGLGAATATENCYQDIMDVLNEWTPFGIMRNIAFSAAAKRTKMPIANVNLYNFSRSINYWAAWPLGFHKSDWGWFNLVRRPKGARGKQYRDLLREVVVLMADVRPNRQHQAETFKKLAEMAAIDASVKKTETEWLWEEWVQKSKAEPPFYAYNGVGWEGYCECVCYARERVFLRRGPASYRGAVDVLMRPKADNFDQIEAACNAIPICEVGLKTR